MAVPNNRKNKWIRLEGLKSLHCVLVESLNLNRQKNVTVTWQGCLWVLCLNTCCREHGGMKSVPLSLTPQFLPCCSVTGPDLCDLLCLLGLFWSLRPTTWLSSLPGRRSDITFHVTCKKDSTGGIDSSSL